MSKKERISWKQRAKDPDYRHTVGRTAAVGFVGGGGGLARCLTAAILSRRLRSNAPSYWRRSPGGRRSDGLGRHSSRRQATGWPSRCIRRALTPMTSTRPTIRACLMT